VRNMVWVKSGNVIFTYEKRLNIILKRETDEVCDDPANRSCKRKRNRHRADLTKSKGVSAKLIWQKKK
jgi:hypothetical protein